MFAAAAIRRGEYIMYVDTEDALDIGWASQFGIDVDDTTGEIVDPHFFLIQPESLEEALDAIIAATKMRIEIDGESVCPFSLIILDSIAAAATVEELNGTMKDNQVGDKARKMSKFCRKVKGALRESEATLIGINQNREKIGVMFGSPETQPGGKGFRFFSSIRVRLGTQGKTIANKSTGEVLGYTFRGTTKKNKCAPPFREFEFVCYIDGDLAGADLYTEVAQIGKELGVFTDKEGERIASNCKWHFMGEGVATGKNAVIGALEDDDDLFNRALTAVSVAIDEKARLKPRTVLAFASDPVLNEEERNLNEQPA